mmetsp:Transcript_54194/g.117101  ORF Transcript_54194/g.117101 Transcript_54194/m.117101 type:complete len:253 (+) Transcript_54194:603-1361(+)
MSPCKATASGKPRCCRVLSNPAASFLYKAKTRIFFFLWTFKSSRSLGIFALASRMHSTSCTILSLAVGGPSVTTPSPLLPPASSASPPVEFCNASAPPLFLAPTVIVAVLPLRVMLKASLCTALGHVALKNTVCLVAGLNAAISLTSSTKPISNILSASSRAKTCTMERSRAGLSMLQRSRSLPVVAQTMSAPFDLMSRHWSALGSPPTMVRTGYWASPAEVKLANSSTTDAICWTSSLVGARTTIRGLQLG